MGTGENNNQRSVAYGDGVYKSDDGGKSWINVGLKKSEHIGKIIIHPTNSNIVYVAAYGPLWSEGGDRGLYKTEDGGKNWTKVCHHILAQYNESDLDQKERKEKIIDLVFEKMEIGEALDLCDRRDRLEKALLTVLKKGGGSFFTAF